MAATNRPVVRGLDIYRSKTVADAYMTMNEGLHGLLEKSKSTNPEVQFQQAAQKQKQRLEMMNQLKQGPTLPVPDEFKPKPGR